MSWQTIFTGLAVVVAALSLIDNRRQNGKQRALMEQQQELDRQQKDLAEQQHGLMTRQFEWEQQTREQQAAFEREMEERRERQRVDDLTPKLAVTITRGVCNSWGGEELLPAIVGKCVNVGTAPVFADGGVQLRVRGRDRTLDLNQWDMCDNQAPASGELVRGDSLGTMWNWELVNQALLRIYPNEHTFDVEAYVRLRNGEEFRSEETLRIVTSEKWQA